MTDEPESVGDSVVAILSRIRARVGDLAQDAYATRCGKRHLLDPANAEAQPGQELCDGAVHWIGGQRGRLATGRCPKVIEDENRARVPVEAKRLAAELGNLSHRFDPKRSGLVGGDSALEVMRRFVLDPSFKVLLIGPTGLGKSHLLLRSHMELLGRGVSSQYVRTFELRRLFRLADSYDAEVADHALGKLERFVYARAVHFDDLGDIEDDQSPRGQFAKWLKQLVERTRAKWAVATNRSSDELERHPDLTGAILSRLLANCERVVLDGPDYRVQSVRSETRRSA
jgi:DNA replication protein DnaC